MENKYQVALTKCSSYSPEELEKNLTELLAELGGIESFVKSGQSVLIKPNMLTDRTPEQAVTTHPELIRVIIRLVKECGATPSVADSPSSAVKLEKVWEKTGIKAVCDEENVPLLNLEKAGSTNFNTNNCSFSISKPILNADVIINVPKVKTHILTTYTGAVKNMYGTIPGYQKANLHKLYPTMNAFGKLMASVYISVKPQLNIADGIIGMEGDGPSGGKPKKMNLLAASPNALALDLIICEILRIDPRSVPYLQELQNTKEHALNPDDIQIKGGDTKDFYLQDICSPSTLAARLIPGVLVKILDPFLWIRPSFTDECVFCGRCVEACPVNALTEKKGEKPVLDSKKCIGCCCCHEVCPEKAVAMKQSFLLNFLRKGKTL